MAINFPSSPTNGQTFDQGTVQYTFSGGVWNAAPLPTALPRNLLINPEFKVAQDNAVGVYGVVSGHYVVDQWAIFGTIVPKGQQYVGNAFGNPAGSPNMLVQTLWTGLYPTLAVGDYLAEGQHLEGNVIAPLKFGTADAVQMVLRFWIMGNSGNTTPLTSAISIRNLAGTRSFVFPFTIPAANTWYKIEKVIPGDIAGTWVTGNAGAMSVWWVWASGTTYVTPTANAWIAGNFLAPTGISNMASEYKGTYLVAPGLYADPNKTGKAPPWTSPDIGQTMADCQRYWYRAASGQGMASSATAITRLGLAHPINMRAAPAAALEGAPTIYDATVNNALTAISGAYSNSYMFESNGTGTGLTATRAVTMRGDTTTNGVAMSSRM